DLVQLCRDLLSEYGVDRRAGRFELFTTAEPCEPLTRPRPVPLTRGGPTLTIHFRLDRTSATVQSPRSAHAAVLIAAPRLGTDVPSACAGGVCGTGRARLVEGSVQMRKNYALEPDELERGYVLTCQSRPPSEHITIDYDA